MTIQELKKEIRAKDLELRDLRKKAAPSNDVEELRSISQKMDVVREERDKLEDQLYEIENGGSQDEDTRTRVINESEQNSQKPPLYVSGQGFKPVARTSGSSISRMQILGSYGIGTGINEKRGDDLMFNKELNDKYEQRAAYLKEGKSAVFTADEVQELRAIAVGTAGIVTSGGTGSTLVPGQLQVGSIVDKVFNMPLIGGESYKQGYEKATADAGVTAQGADSLDAEPTFGYSDINKLRFTAYAELTSQVIKLSPVQYSAYVMLAMQNSIRKILSKHIVSGTGATAGLAGISTATTASGLVTEASLSAIDNATLDKIVFGFGGDLSMGIATLILKKADLAAFAAVRTTNGEPVYKIEFDAGNPNAGFISSNDSYKVPYVITDQLSALSAVGTVADTVCMAYGDLRKYYLVNFSDLEVSRSDDYQFKKGNVAFRGELYCGGNICGYQAFSKILKGA